MIVRELKALVNSLPPQCDDFRVEIVARVDQLGPDHWAREDHPVSGSILDEQNGEFLLAHSEQLEKLKAYVGQTTHR
jgi:hypothetical protein